MSHKNKNRFKLSFIISCIIHVIIVILIMWLQDDDKKKAPDPIPITVLSPQDIEQLKPLSPQELGIQPEPQPPPQEQQQQPVPPPQPSLPPQIVEVPKPDKEEKPEDTRLKSEHDSKADDQTVARGEEDQEIAKKPEPGNDGGEGGGEPDDKPVDNSGKDDGTEENPDDGLDVAKGDESKKNEGPPQYPNLHPSDDLLGKIGGGGNVDYIPEVGIGDETALSTIKDRHAPFFNRVKRSIAQKWNPIYVHKINDPTGNKWGYGMKVTKVFITLEPSGKVRSVIVDKTSGVKELDEEARQAVLRAMHFANPPKDLIKNGKIEFFFGFHFDIVKS